MPLGRPAIPTPGRLDLRPVAEAISAARQRIEALETAINAFINSAANPATTSATLASLQAQLTALTRATGTVTSVDLTAPDILTVTGAPITGAGTIALDLADQSASTVFAGPVSGADAAPTFRALQWDFDLPLITSTSFTSGLDGDEAVLIEQYGTLSWTTTRAIAALGGGGGGGSPGGSSGQVQYNAGGAFGGAANISVVSGNLTFANGARILGDFSTTTYANRPAYQSNVVNGITDFMLLPNGTGTTAGIAAMNSSGATNAAVANLYVNSTEAVLSSITVGSGTAVPLQFKYGPAGSTVVGGMMFTNGNWNFGAATSDPGVKLRVEGAATVSTGNFVVSLGNITATVGNIVATVGNIQATAGTITASNNIFQSLSSAAGYYTADRTTTTQGFYMYATGASWRVNFNGSLDVLTVSSTGKINIEKTVTGTVGAVTINKPSGRVNIAAAGTSVVVTNSMVDANSIILCTIATNDATATIKNVVAGSGSFTITLNAAATAQTAINFLVTN